MLSVVVGPNYFAAKEYLDEKIASFIEEHGAISVERFDAEVSTREEIINSMQSTSFLSPEKLIIISNFSANKDLAAELDNLQESISDNNKVIIFESKPDKRSTYYKKLKTTKDFHEFAELNEQQLKDWVIQNAKKAGAVISSSDANYLITRIGLNQSKVNNELKKLIEFNKNIDRNSIDELTDPTPQSSVFNLIDAAFSGSLNRTMELYDDQRSQGVEPLNILGMIVWQMHAVAVTDSAKGKSPQEISSASGLSPFVVQKSLSISKKLGTAKTKQILQKLVDLDAAFKNVTIDQDTAMKNFLTVLSYK